MRRNVRGRVPRSKPKQSQKASRSPTGERANNEASQPETSDRRGRTYSMAPSMERRGRERDEGGSVLYRRLYAHRATDEPNLFAHAQRSLFGSF